MENNKLTTILNDEYLKQDIMQDYVPEELRKKLDSANDYREGRRLVEAYLKDSVKDLKHIPVSGLKVTDEVFLKEEELNNLSTWGDFRILERIRFCDDCTVVAYSFLEEEGSCEGMVKYYLYFDALKNMAFDIGTLEALSLFVPISKLSMFKNALIADFAEARNTILDQINESLAEWMPGGVFGDYCGTYDIRYIHYSLDKKSSINEICYMGCEIFDVGFNTYGIPDELDDLLNDYFSSYPYNTETWSCWIAAHLM